jgi:predicted DNA-binding ribbon-helix-helix protein
VLQPDTQNGFTGMPKIDEQADDQRSSVRTTVTLPKDNYTELEKLAELKKVSVAWVIREAVDRYLNRKTPLFRE